MRLGLLITIFISKFKIFVFFSSKTLIFYLEANFNKRIEKLNIGRKIVTLLTRSRSWPVRVRHIARYALSVDRLFLKKWPKLFVAFFFKCFWSAFCLFKLWLLSFIIKEFQMKKAQHLTVALRFLRKCSTSTKVFCII